jgi:hypothetical protein
MGKRQRRKGAAFPPFIILVLSVLSILLSLLSLFRDYTSIFGKQSLKELGVAIDEITTSNELDQKKRILVVYTGPSDKSSELVELYQRNTDFFLKHGVDCANQDTVIVVGHDFYDQYLPAVEQLDKSCHSQHRGRVLLVARRNVCYDMESMRLVLYGGVNGLNVDSYDYLMYINCGVTGPSPDYKGGEVPWTTHLIDKLKGNVVMSGLSANCEILHPSKKAHPHIQSMMYALNRVGLDIIKNSSSVYDCLLNPKDASRAGIIDRYERGMSRTIINSGYAIAPLLTEPSNEMNDMIITEKTLKKCKRSDIWTVTDELKSIYGGRLPFLNETFYKTSKDIPHEIAQLINYTNS